MVGVVVFLGPLEGTFCVVLYHYIFLKPSVQVLREMFFRANVLGSKELNRGHVAQKNKAPIFVSLMLQISNHRRALGVCASAICVIKITAFGPR